MNKDTKFVLCFSLIFLTNALALYVHNRLNALLYLLLLGVYLLLYCPRLAPGLRKLFFNSRQTAVNWFLCVYAPVLLALYYLNFELLLLNFALNVLLSVWAWRLKNKE